LLRMNPHEPPGPKVHVRGEGVISDGKWGCDSSYQVVVTRRDHKKILPLGVASYPLFPPLHMGWLNHFRVLSPKACGT
jgi:hypothetical protein